MFEDRSSIPAHPLLAVANYQLEFRGHVPSSDVLGYRHSSFPLIARENSGKKDVRDYAPARTRIKANSFGEKLVRSRCGCSTGDSQSTDCNCSSQLLQLSALIPGSVSRARYARPKGNFLLGVITRCCVHTSSATFPQLLAQLARPGFTVNCCTRVLATNRRGLTPLPIDQLAISPRIRGSVSANVIGRGRDDFWLIGSGFAISVLWSPHLFSESFIHFSSRFRLAGVFRINVRFD